MIGAWDVEIANPDAQTVTGAGVFTVTIPPAPTYTTIVPASGANNAAVAVTITGTNYYGTPAVTLKKAGQADITATGVVLTGSTTIDCTFDLTNAATGLWDVEITNPDAQTVTGANAFTVTLPSPPNDTGTSDGSSDSSGDTGSQTVVFTTSLNAGERTTIAIAPRSGSTVPGPVNVIDISFIPATSIGESMIIVKQADPGTPLRLPGDPPALYLEITMHWARSDAIQEADIRFTVSESWLVTNHLAPADIVMMRYHDGSWSALPTRLENTGGGVCTYVANSQGLSYFAVMGNATAAVQGSNPEVPAPAVTEVATLEQAGPVEAQPVARQADTILQATTPTTAVPAAPRTPWLPAATIAACIAGCAGLVIGAVLVRRWWIRRQNPALFKKYD